MEVFINVFLLIKNVRELDKILRNRLKRVLCKKIIKRFVLHINESGCLFTDADAINGCA